MDVLCWGLPVPGHPSAPCYCYAAALLFISRALHKPGTVFILFYFFSVVVANQRNMEGEQSLQHPVCRASLFL